MTVTLLMKSCSFVGSLPILLRTLRKKPLILHRGVCFLQPPKNLAHVPLMRRWTLGLESRVGEIKLNNISYCHWFYFTLFSILEILKRFLFSVVIRTSKIIWNELIEGIILNQGQQATVLQQRSQKQRQRSWRGDSLSWLGRAPQCWRQQVDP